MKTAAAPDHPERGREALCTEDHLIVDAFGTVMRLLMGKVYRVSLPRKGRVTVFCEPMVMAPAYLFRRKRRGETYSRSRHAFELRRAWWRLAEQQRKEAA